MRAGFSFKGQHSSDFGVTVRTNDRPVRPEMKVSSYNPTNADSEYSFAASNPYGHEYYEDKIFQLEINVAADNLYELQRKLTKLSRWIMGSGELIFDDTALVKWDARIIETVSYMPEHSGKNAKLLVKYRVKPFSRLVFNTIDGPCIDNEIELDSDIPLDMSEYFIFKGAGTHIVNNIGDMPVRPVITVTGVTKSYSMECNGFTLILPKNAIIDCERYTVTDISGNNLMSEVTGEFFELMPGSNPMTVTSGEDIAIEVKYEARHIHSADLQNTGLEE